MENPAVSAKIVSIVIRALLGLLFISLVIGQTGRLALSGQGGGMLMSDIASALFLVGIGTLFFMGVGWQRASSSVFGVIAVVPFLVWSISVLIIKMYELEQDEVSIALLYWARLASILLLLPAGMLCIGTGRIKRYAKGLFVGTYIALLLLGFLQLVFFPNLEGLGEGWDPHNQRMVATWLDPNFFGAFLAIGLPATILWIRFKNQRATQIVRTLCLVAAAAAILLTKSRSTYIAGFVALGVCGVIWLFSSSLSRGWKKMAISGVVTLIVALGLATVALQERATQVFLHDPTITLRLNAYQLVWDRLVEQNILFGVGYNAYQFAARDAGLISNFLIHSRSGSDSSILTLLVTTGVVGTVLFLIPLLIGSVWHAGRWFKERNYQSLIFIWATVFLLVHSQFENSLLYPHLLIPYILITILVL
jgi:O-antigen ligase